MLLTGIEDLEETKSIEIQETHLCPKPLALRRLRMNSQSMQSKALVKSILKKEISAFFLEQE